jgi:hypothetical protein
MKRFDWKKLLPHAIAVAIFLVVALAYCKPAIEGKVLQQSDITQWKGMAKDIYDFKAKNGEAPLWTNGMFSGMPGYLIAGKTNNVVPYYFTEAISLFLPKPFQFFFLACICFYFLAQVLRTNPWVSIVGALGFAYATYNPVIVAVGHDTKMLSIALLPGLLASLILIYEKKYLIGAALTAMFAGALVSQNHYQIVYYGLIAALLMTIAYAIHWILTKDFKHLAIAALVTILSGVTGALSNAVVLLPNYEYTEATIRGGSALADSTSRIGKEGLSKDYAFSYSMFKSEPLVLMFPNMFGGSSDHAEMKEDKSKTVEALQGMQQQMQQQLGQYFVSQNEQGEIFPRTYWGGIGGTSGPPYAGAIICFLAILAFFVLDGKHKWWILTATVLTVMMSWGSYFDGFNSWLLKVLPMYNKFRAPSMIMVVPTLLFCMLAVLALQKILFDTTNNAELWNKMKKGFIAAASVVVFAFALYINFEYQSDNENELVKQVAQIQDAQQKSFFEQPVKSLVNAIKEDRQTLFLNSILRTFFFAAVAGLVLWLANRKTIKPAIAIAVIGLFAFIDVMAVNVTYLNSNNFKEKEEYNVVFEPTASDLQILQDKSFYRVLDVAQGIGAAFNQGALVSYFHKNIGGYHPAKLSIYQDLIEKQLYNYPNCKPVLDMLNTKYIITGQPGQTTVQTNTGALGAAWFVKGVRFTKTAKEEMDALTSLNVKDSAVANESFSKVLKSGINYDSTAAIQLVKNSNDSIRYTSTASTEQLAVFSEVYYDKGWNAYVDGQKTEIAKVNYVLRAIMVPAGTHTIEFKFEPISHKTGWTITTITSILMVLLLMAGLFTVWKQRSKTVA